MAIPFLSVKKEKAPSAAKVKQQELQEKSERGVFVPYWAIPVAAGALILLAILLFSGRRDS